MKEINWFDRSVWLEDLPLRIGDLVEVAGRVYQYGMEKGPNHSVLHVLIPVD